MIIFSVITGLAIVGLIAFGIVQQIQIRQMEKQLQGVSKDCKEILRDHPTLVNADLYFSRQLKEINQQLISMEQDIQNLGNMRENDGGYQHALRILEMGGSRDEIVDSCHLSSAEAELLMNLHAYRSAIKVKS